MDASKGEEINPRLEIISSSNDGFYVASEDLKLRGPGDFFGIRQSGELDFRLADIYQDASLLQQASEDVDALLGETDAKTKYPKLYEALKQKQKRHYTNL